MGEKIKRNASMKSAHFLILIRIFSIVRKDKALSGWGKGDDYRLGSRFLIFI